MGNGNGSCVTALGRDKAGVETGQRLRAWAHDIATANAKGDVEADVEANGE